LELCILQPVAFIYFAYISVAHVRLINAIKYFLLTYLYIYSTHIWSKVYWVYYFYWRF